MRKRKPLLKVWYIATYRPTSREYYSENHTRRLEATESTSAAKVEFLARTLGPDQIYARRKYGPDAQCFEPCDWKLVCLYRYEERIIVISLKDK